MDKNLRFGLDYHAEPWEPLQDFSEVDGFAGAIEMCNGAGVCRQETGSMCPTFQASQEEMHSTRGRANLLRELISGKHLSFTEGEQAAYESLSMCLACKGCKAECPSAVDVAKLKYEFFQHYYQAHRRPIRDYLFGFIAEFARFGLPISGLVNSLIRSSLGKMLLERFAGISSNRKLPLLNSKKRKAFPSVTNKGNKAILLSDPFSEYFSPELLSQAGELLEKAGYSILYLPVVGTGRTRLSKGFIRATIKHARNVIDAIDDLDPDGIFPVVVLEPSELSMLKDDFFSFFLNKSNNPIFRKISYGLQNQTTRRPLRG